MGRGDGGRPALSGDSRSVDSGTVETTWATSFVLTVQRALRGAVNGESRPVQLRLFALPPRVNTQPVVADFLARFLVVASVSAYIVLFAYWTTRNHDGFGTHAFDFGIYDQGLWLLSRFERPFVTVMGRHLFGDHTSFILLPLVPFYWIVPSAKVLLVAQAAALGVSAIPVFLLAREKLRNEMLAAVLAAAFLLQPALGWLNWEQFHPDVFEIPLILFALWFMEKRRWGWFLACTGAALLVKEDVALLTFALGIYVALRHDRRVGILTSGVSLLYLAAALWWILPALNGVGTLNAWRIPFGGPGGVIRTAFTRPGQLISYVLSDSRPWYLWQLLAPMALLPLLAPSVALVAILPVAANLLTNFPYQYDIHYHYTAPILPVLAAATVFAVARAPVEARAKLVGLFAGSTLVCAYLWGPTPLGIHERQPADPDYPTISLVNAAIDMIPADAVVSAHYTFVPQLTHRHEIYMFPNPFKAAYWGTFTMEGQRLPRADRVEYLLLPETLDAELQAVVDSVRDEFDRVPTAESVTLLKRRPA